MNIKQFISQLDLNISLDKLGASSWQKRKAEAKKKIKDAAKKLIKIASKRLQSESFPINIKKAKSF